MTQAMRTLILMRHAKSGYPGGVRDHDRPLAERGLREAALAGQWIRRHLPRVDEVLTSTATRAIETSAALSATAPLRRATELYDATPEDILERIRSTAPAVMTLLVVGHAPGLPALAQELTSEDGDPTAMADLASRFPTSALAVLEFDAARRWPSLEYATARLVTFHIPRD